MINVYDATDKQKNEIMDCLNEDRAYYKRWQNAKIEELVLICKTNQFPLKGVVQPTSDKTSHWTLNGANLQHRDFIMIEPFEEQMNNPGLLKINEVDTCFEQDMQLSKRAVILMSVEKYEELCKDSNFKKETRNLNITLYKGDENLALKMLLMDKGFVRFEINDEGFILEEESDTKEFGEKLQVLQKELTEELKQINTNGNYSEKQQDSECSPEKQNQKKKLQKKKKIMLTGLTPSTEGELELDGVCYASTAIGKKRENQEDAVLLLKDKINSKFKMMVVADGMGGEQKGEIASNVLINGLKRWFENLSDEEKDFFYTGVANFQDCLNKKINEISEQIANILYGLGGTTLVCAIIGENDTLITNVGDSRAYVIQNGRLKQVTIDDAIVQEEMEKGNIPNKDAMRFHREAAGITECVGMGKIESIHSTVLNNHDYDMLLLFSDGVTDCLSENDIAVICKNADRKKIAQILVKKSIEHDSIAPDELIENYVDFNIYIPGGKDNSTTAIYLNERE